MNKKKTLMNIVKDFECANKEDVLFIYHIVNYKLDMRELKDNTFDAYRITKRYFRIQEQVE